MSARMLVVFALVLGLLSVPVATFAETAVVRLVSYEVTESLTFKPKKASDPSDFTRRMAAASLLGVEVTPLAPGTPFAAGQFITADATSNVDLASGLGPVKGTVQILTDLDPTRSSLDTLVVALEITIAGELDLSTATQGFATIDGTWRARHRSGLRGSFAGFFLIPFQLPGLGDQYWYLDLGPGSCAQPSPVAGLCPLTTSEFALGIPLTKAVITLSARSRSLSR